MDRESCMVVEDKAFDRVMGDVYEKLGGWVSLDFVVDQLNIDGDPDAISRELAALETECSPTPPSGEEPPTTPEE